MSTTKKTTEKDDNNNLEPIVPFLFSPTSTLGVRPGQLLFSELAQLLLQPEWAAANCTSFFALRILFPMFNPRSSHARVRRSRAAEQARRSVQLTGEDFFRTRRMQNEMTSGTSKKHNRV
jgi:hypothetical protein